MFCTFVVSLCMYLSFKCLFCKLGGLDLSRLCLDWDSWSQQWQKVSLNILTLKKSLSWRLRYLDWDSKVSILKILAKTKKNLSRQLRTSWQVSNVYLDRSRSLGLDLDWSQLSRPPSLLFCTFKLSIDNSHQINQII